MEPGRSATQGMDLRIGRRPRSSRYRLRDVRDARVRYVHHMEHPDYRESLGVGCICAQHMENDYEAPRRRERTLRNAAQRRRRWLSRKWQVSAKGNAYLNTDGINITVYRRTRILWRARIEEQATGRSVTSKGRYTNEDAAKLAAFDAMIFLKHERGWGI